jgi:hypothetical protein
MAIKKMTVDKLNSVIQECIAWKSLVTVTEWGNRHGCEIHITSMHGGIQHLSITYEEFDLVKDAIKKLGNL